MNPTLMTGTIVVTCALIAYSIGVLTEQRRKALSPRIMTALTIGITLDITATCFMIAGSRNSPFTLHGFLGYSALAAMLVDILLTWRFWRSPQRGKAVPHRLHLYTRYAYVWWVAAYIAGAIIAMTGLR